MSRSKLVLLNASIVTAYGSYIYQPIALTGAKELVQKFQREDKLIESAIGHQSTAELLSMLLEFDVPVNRMEFNQTTDQLALIFKLNRRPPEGKILTRKEIEEIGFELGLLSRTS